MKKLPQRLMESRSFSAQAQRMADLLVFAAVAEHGSLAAAADALDLARSSASKQLSRLEDQLGVTLMHRTTRRTALTDAGRELLLSARSMVQASREAGDSMSGHQRVPSGRLRVTASFTYAHHVLAPLLPEFHRRYPEVQVDLRLADRYVDLWEEDLDLALRLTTSPPPGLAGRPLQACDFVICATPEFLRGQPVRKPADLSGLPCLAYQGPGSGAATEWRLSRAQESVRVKVQAPVRANSSDVVRQLVLSHLGLGLLPLFAVQPDLEAGTLRRVLGSWTPQGPWGPIAWALWQPQRAMAPKLRAMVDFLVEKLADPPLKKTKPGPY